jgi:hypothetical protein
MNAVRAVRILLSACGAFWMLFVGPLAGAGAALLRFAAAARRRA